MRQEHKLPYHIERPTLTKMSVLAVGLSSIYIAKEDWPEEVLLLKRLEYSSLFSWQVLHSYDLLITSVTFIIVFYFYFISF